MLSGLLNLNKPPGITSRRTVDRVQRLVRPAKAGHAGTLDPLASGVLVVCVGAATRLIEYVQRMPKCYSGTFLLGRTSPTEDVEGDVTLLAGAPQPSADEVILAARQFVGLVEQRPPAFSALKVAGQRAYDLARAGKEVELKPRQVRIDHVEVVRYEYPELVLKVECGGGTYIRSLGRDLARSLGTDAVMSALVRTAIGDLRIEDACDPDRLTSELLRRHLLPPLCALSGLPVVELTHEQVHRLSQGQEIPETLPPGASEAAGLDSDGRLVAILATRPNHRLGPLRTFAEG